MGTSRPRRPDRTPHGGGRSPLVDLHPYFFHRDTADVARESLRGTSSAHREPSAPGTPEALLREQRRTLFAHDILFQQLFDGDFEAFCAALDEPWRLDERLRQRTLPRFHGDMSVLRTWDDLRAPTRSWESQRYSDEESLQETQQEGPAFQGDPVYDHAFQFACRAERWSRRLSAGQRVPDPALLRIFGNAALVPAKVAFGVTAGFDDDVPGMVTAAVGYRQAAIFLHRILDALGECFRRQLGRSQTVHDLLDEGRELLADIESRIAELESAIRHRGTRSS